MHQILIEAAWGGLLLAVLWTIVIGQGIIHSRRIPVCWNCGQAKIRLSQSRGFFDILAAASLMTPFRCSACRIRFYGFRATRRVPQRTSPRSAAAVASR
jgi:hypothetical protein